MRACIRGAFAFVLWWRPICRRCRIFCISSCETCNTSFLRNSTRPLQNFCDSLGITVGNAEINRIWTQFYQKGEVNDVLISMKCLCHVRKMSHRNLHHSPLPSVLPCADRCIIQIASFQTIYQQVRSELAWVKFIGRHDRLESLHAWHVFGLCSKIRRMRLWLRVRFNLKQKCFRAYVRDTYIVNIDRPPGTSN